MIHNSQATKETRKSDHSAVQSISLPKGGGAIRGIGEKFAANQVTGTGSMSVPIATSPGRSGFGPQLNLTYNSGTGNSPFGFGWNLSIPSISRKTDKGLPQYNDAAESDVFILSGAEDLVPILGRQEERGVPESPADRTVGTVIYDVKGYRPRIEGLFARIERWTNQDDPKDVFWRSISTDNITTWYGKDINSRITDPSDPARIFSWLICESHDDKGNVMVYRYKEENSIGVDHSKANELNRTQESRTANRYLKRIRYGNNKPCYPELRPDKPWHPPTGADDENARGAWHFEIVFDYGEHDLEKPAPAGTGNWKKRNDPFSIYRPGFEVRTMRLCRRVLMFHHFPDEKSAGSDCLVSSTDFTYSHEQDPEHVRNPVYTFLRKVTQSGYKLQEDGSYLKKSLPPLEFEYTRPVVQDEMKTWDTDSPDDLPMGLDVDADSLENLPIGLDGALYQWTDLHGEGIPGILTEQGDGWFYKRNLSPINEKLFNGKRIVEPAFAPVERVAVKPSLALAEGAQFMDLAGDGLPDLVVMDGPMPGLYEHDGDEGWHPFRPFTARLNRDTRDPNLRFIDLDGDGHADVLITEDDAFVWHASLAEEGFGPARRVAQALDEEKGPRLVFADSTQSIHMAEGKPHLLTRTVNNLGAETRVHYAPSSKFYLQDKQDGKPWITRLPCEALTFELTGYPATGDAGRYRAEDFVEPDPAQPSRPRHRFTTQVAYEEQTSGDYCRRPIERLRILYRPDHCGVVQGDALALLPLGALEPLALPGESYQLAFTPGLLDGVFRRDGMPLQPFDLRTAGWGAGSCPV